MDLLRNGLGQHRRFRVLALLRGAAQGNASAFPVASCLLLSRQRTTYAAPARFASELPSKSVLTRLARASESSFDSDGSAQRASELRRRSGAEVNRYSKPATERSRDRFETYRCRRCSKHTPMWSEILR